MMLKPLLIFTLLLAFGYLQTSAQDASIFPKGEVSKTDNHTGTIWLTELNQPDTTFSFSLAQATFGANAKLDWHLHPAGQYLLVTKGSGFYQERGKPVQTVRMGDVIKCLPNVEHWHGSSPNSDFAYIGVTPTQRGKTVWLKRVIDQEYRRGSVTSTVNTSVDEEIKALSKRKWAWMADKNVDSLTTLFDDKSVFVHMGGSWGKEQEVNIIKSGGIWYKKADIHSVSVNVIGNTAILLNNITLLAVVGGNEVTNNFIVTEVYINEHNKWLLGSLSFTKLMSPGDAQR